MKQMFFIKKIVTIFLLLSTRLEAFSPCVNKAFLQLGIKENYMSRPELMKSILEDEMYLGDFEPFVQAIEPFLNNQISFDPMIREIKKAITDQHPAIVSFLCEAVSDGMFEDTQDLYYRVERVLHHSFLLNELVKEMASLDFTLKLKDYFEDLKSQNGVRSSFFGELIDVFKTTHSLFQTAKLVTVDKKTIAQYIDFRKRMDLTSEDLKAKNRGLRLNILEARQADIFRGFKDNAAVASVLKDSPIKEIFVFGDKENNIVIQKFAPGWHSLYQTWNLAFVTGNLDDLDVIYPKLLIPEVINAHPDLYLYKRGIALWVTTNIVLLRRLKGIEPLPVSPKMKKIAKAWGSINRVFAEQFLIENNEK